MSRDNIVLIKKTEEGMFNGYNISCEDRQNLDSKIPNFEVNTIEEAIIEAQKIPSEYGYMFTNLNEFASKVRKIKIEAILSLNEETWDVDEILKSHNLNNLEFDRSEYISYKISEIK